MHILEQYLNKEVAVEYWWNGIGRRHDEKEKRIEYRTGIIREINDEEVCLEITGIIPVVEPFGKIKFHRISFQRNDISELLIVSFQGQTIYV